MDGKQNIWDVLYTCIVADVKFLTLRVLWDMVLYF